MLKHSAMPVEKTKQYLIQIAPIKVSLILLFTLATAACFLLSLFTPFIQVKNFWIFKNTVSLISSLSTLYHGGDYFLLVVVLFLATFVVPTAKLIILVYACVFCKANRMPYSLTLIKTLGKWSMVDVFVVAIMVVAIKLGSFLEVKIKVGVLLFSATVILSNLLTQYLSYLFQCHNPESETKR